MRHRQFLLLCGGLVVGTLVGCNFHFTMSDGYVFDFRGEQAQKRDGGPLAAKVERIEIENQFGDVHVQPAPGGDSQWSWDVTCWSTTSEQAERLLDQIEMRWEETGAEGEVSRWKLVLPETPAPELRGVRSHLTISAPPHVQVQIKNRGDVDVAGMAGATRIENRHGDVAVRELSGACEISNEHGDLAAENIDSGRFSNRHGATTIQGVAHDVSVNGQHGRVQVVDVQGNLTVDAQHSSITANQVAGRADLKTAHAKITASGIGEGATLHNRHGAIQAIDARGRIDADNQHGSIDIRGDADELSCRNQHGAIQLTLTNPQLISVRAETSHNSIRVQLASSLAPIISAAAEYGKLHSDFPMNVAAESDREGPRLDLKTRHGDIHVRLSSDAEPPAD